MVGRTYGDQKILLDILVEISVLESCDECMSTGQENIQEKGF